MLQGLGLIPDEVIEFFKLPNPSNSIMALRLTQLLTEMITRKFFQGRGAGA
jgi:hypothetical protein